MNYKMEIPELIIDMPLILFIGIFSIPMVLGDFAHKVIDWYIDKTTDYLNPLEIKSNKVKNRK